MDIPVPESVNPINNTKPVPAHTPKPSKPRPDSTTAGQVTPEVISTQDIVSEAKTSESATPHSVCTSTSPMILEGTSAENVSPDCDKVEIMTAPPEPQLVEWYYYLSGQKLGPVPPETIVAMIRTGALNSATQIWRVGLTEWVPLGATPDFAACCTVTNQTPTATNDAARKDSDFLIPAGYICAGISILLFPPAFALAGISIGIINLTKGRVDTGVIQIVLSFICGFVGVMFGIEMMSRVSP